MKELHGKDKDKALENQKLLEILIVDDDKIVSLIHKHALKRSKITYQPVLCANGKEALDYLKANRKRNITFLALLDLNMSIMGGWVFLERTKEMTFEGKLVVVVVVVSSSINKADFIRTRDYKQVIGFFNKPLSAEDLGDLKNLEEIKRFFIAGS